jgi:hypothetical protein
VLAEALIFPTPRPVLSQMPKARHRATRHRNDLLY